MERTRSRTSSRFSWQNESLMPVNEASVHLISNVIWFILSLWSFEWDNNKKIINIIERVKRNRNSKDERKLRSLSLCIFSDFHSTYKYFRCYAVFHSILCVSLACVHLCFRKKCVAAYTHAYGTYVDACVAIKIFCACYVEQDCRIT